MHKKIEMPNVTKNKNLAKGRALVYQGNPLIQSRKYFNTHGTRLFILGLMTLNPHLSKNDKFFDKEFPLVHISTSELTKLFEHTEYLSMLEGECKTLFNSSITLKYTDKSFTLMHIFDVMEYKSNDGLYIQFDPKMKEYLLELVEGGYTAVSIAQIFKLTSTYAVRLIELCLQHRNMTKGNIIERKLTIEEIRFYLNVPDKAYEGRLDNFKRFVLDEPIAEIERITDFRMSYSVEKEGRRVKSFVFKLDISKFPADTFNIKAECVERLPMPAPYADVLGELVNQGFSRKAAQDILTAMNDNEEVGRRLRYAVKIMPEYSKKNPIQNKQGFLRKAILENWRGKNQTAEKPVEKRSVVIPKDQTRIIDYQKFMDDTGISKADLQGEEIPICLAFVDLIKKCLASGEELTPAYYTALGRCNFTVSRFKEVYMKNFVPVELEEKVPEKPKAVEGFSTLADVFKSLQ